jgi:hypothetical protein
MRRLKMEPNTRPSTQCCAMLPIVNDAMEAYGWSGEAARPAIPGAAQITRMDEALSWVALIPSDKMVLRRVVHARCLVHPVTDRHRYTWKQLARSLGADARAVQRWHEQAINLIVRGIINSAKRAA